MFKIKYVEKRSDVIECYKSNIVNVIGISEVEFLIDSYSCNSIVYNRKHSFQWYIFFIKLHWQSYTKCSIANVLGVEIPSG